MSMASFINLCTHTINLVKRNRNVSGDFITVSTIPNLKGFVQYGDHLITNDKGETLKATAIVFLKDNCGIDINWEYWMINQIAPYTRSNMEVLKIDPIDDPRTGKTHHFELAVR
jgi:hypothetical protein